jgi:methylated-DNA-[protein]-cysteine S-methyltransferase
MTPRIGDLKELEARLRREAKRPPGAGMARAREGLGRRAQDDGLVDVAYAMVDSPIGELLAAATARGLVTLAFPTNAWDTVLGDLAFRVSPRIMEAPGRLDGVRRELDEYFEGRRRRFDTPLDWRLIRGFHTAVLRHTARIPYGEVSTYREMATRAGSPLAVRAAGNALATNPIPIIIPCHRVLRTGGGLGGYGGGLDVKQRLLALEGARPTGS